MHLECFCNNKRLWESFCLFFLGQRRKERRIEEERKGKEKGRKEGNREREKDQKGKKGGTKEKEEGKGRREIKKGRTDTASELDTPRFKFQLHYLRDV